MKKITILMAALALAFMAVPALALTNIVVNGDFQASNSLPIPNWQNGTISGHTYFNLQNILTNYFATSYSSGSEAVMYQICDASTGGGWILGGTAETINFSFQYQKPVAGNTAEYGIWYSTDTTAPNFGGPDNPGAGWTLLSQSTSLSITGIPTNFTPVTVSDTLPVQPQWFAVAFEGESTTTGYNVAFDKISLTTQCSGVPVPPSTLLFGSGLVGLVGWRRFRKS